MEIEQYLYDLNSSGDAIIAYTMRSESGASVELCNLGASILSLSLPNKEGKIESIASGVTMRGLSGINGDFDSGINFAERLWESRVETNRVVMTLSYDRNGVGIMNEAIFDFDDDNTLEITYIACVDQDSIFDLTQRLSFNSNETNVRIISDAKSSEDNIYPITGAKPNILSEVATIHTADLGGEITLLSSQPNLYFDGESIMPISTKSNILEAEARFIQKSVFRFSAK